MSNEKFLAIVIVVCAASAVLAKPGGLPFQFAKHQTLCRTRVVYDTNEDRIPKTIKMLKCEDDPYVMCAAGDGKCAPCCGAPAFLGATKFSCIEVLDTVLVKYIKPTMKEDTLDVAIGCSCLKENPDKASE